MFFELSKIFWLVAAPERLVFLCLVLGTLLLWTRWRRAGRWLVVAAGLVLSVTAVVPAGSYLFAKLENRFPVLKELPSRIDGIVVLGGAVDPSITKVRDQLSLNDASERLTEFVVLARRYPEAKLIYSGGSGLLWDQSLKEADAVKPFIGGLGLDASRVTFENQSRNTWENAVFSHRLAGPKAGETWLLVTSAAHMPRAVGCFRKADFPVVPYPVDFHFAPDESFGLTFQPLSGLIHLGSALHAWIGLAGYWLMGKIDAPFPAPDARP